MSGLSVEHDISPARLYKYLPERYVAAYLQGDILFRNLCEFMYSDDIARADALEGSHVDWPLGGGNLHNLTDDAPIPGEWAMRRSIAHPGKFFLHCVSTHYSRDLHSRFGETCIEIADPTQFSSRLRKAILGQITKLDRSSIRFDHVEYYDPRRSQTVRSIEVAGNLPFFKPIKYSNEKEFRFTFSREKALKSVMQATLPEYDRLKEFAVQRSWRSKLIRVGDISDICVVHRTTSVDAA